MLRDKDGNPFPFTVSVTFKDPPQELIPDALRILDEVVRDKTVASQYFRAYMTESLNRHFGYKPAWHVQSAAAVFHSATATEIVKRYNGLIINQIAFGNFW